MKQLLSTLPLSLASALCAAQTFPVTVDSCGDPLTFAAPPKRAVVHDLNMTEMALALKLNASMVGVTGITGWYKTGPEFKTALGSIPELAPKNPNLENILAANPDFFFAGWNYGMKVGGDVTPTTLAKYGIKTLVLSESCIHVNKQRPAASMALLYTDFVKLGTIFGKEAQAKTQVAQWKARVAKITPTSGNKDTRVFLFDSGEDKPFTAGKYAIPTAMIEAQGAETSWPTWRPAGEPPHGKPWRRATPSFWCCWITKTAMA